MAAYTNATAAHHTSRVSHTTHLVPDACGVPLETCAPSASWPWWRIAPPPCTMLQKETSDQDIVDQCRCKNANTAMYPYRGRVAGTQPSASLLGLAPTLRDWRESFSASRPRCKFNRAFLRERRDIRSPTVVPRLTGCRGRFWVSVLPDPLGLVVCCGCTRETAGDNCVESVVTSTAAFGVGAMARAAALGPWAVSDSNTAASSALALGLEAWLPAAPGLPWVPQRRAPSSAPPARAATDRVVGVACGGTGNGGDGPAVDAAAAAPGLPWVPRPPSAPPARAATDRVVGVACGGTGNGGDGPAVDAAAAAPGLPWVPRRRAPPSAPPAPAAMPTCAPTGALLAAEAVRGWRLLLAASTRGARGVGTELKPSSGGFTGSPPSNAGKWRSWPTSWVTTANSRPKGVAARTYHVFCNSHSTSLG